MTRNSTAKVLAAALAVSVLGGCSPFKANLKHQGILKSARFKWRDARPDEQRFRDVGLSITSCSYGIERLGDEAFQPHRVAVLASDLERALGAELEGKSVVLKAYTVHINRSEATRGSMAATNTGVIAALMNDTSVHGCADDDLKGGYKGSEKTTPFSPLIVVIDLEVDGKLVHTRRFESPDENMDGAPQEKKDAWMSAALAAATAQAVANIRAALGLAAAAG